MQAFGDNLWPEKWWKDSKPDTKYTYNAEHVQTAG